MKVKKILLTTMILLLAFTSSACNETKKVEEPVEIHILLPLYDGSQANQVYLDTAKNYHKLNPLITVIFDVVDPLSFTNVELEKRLQSNEPPDIVQMEMNIGQLAAKSGLLLDLLKLFGSNDIDIDQRVLDSTKMDGQLFLIPYWANPQVVIYNKDIFDAANVPYPEGDWTWEQFREISNKIKPRSGSGSVFIYSPYFLENLMASTGKGILSPEGDTSVGYLDSPEAIHAVQWLNAYYHDEKEKTTPANLMDAFQQFYLDFKTGMFIFDFYSGKGNMKDNMGVAPFPHFEGENRANPINFKGIGISSKSKHPQEAWEFIKYLTLTKQETTDTLADYYLTTSKSISEASGQNLDPSKKVAEDELNYAVKSSFDYYPLLNQAWNEDLIAQFEKLLTKANKDLPAELHDLALKLDQEMNRLKNAEDQQTESSSQ